jgi:hypothetical protein
MQICEALKLSPAATRLLSAACVTVGIAFATAAPAQTTAFLPGPFANVSTVPANGDLNPYGVAFINASFQAGTGSAKAGDVLVSNFNNSSNLQGTGSTIVGFNANAHRITFFQGNPGIGLSTALGTLQMGFIVVGNAPSTNGQSSTAGPGSLLVINNQGKLVQTITDPNIQSPWDMALVDNGTTATAYVSNALTGNVSRLTFNVSASGLTQTSSTVIASGYVHRGDPVTFFVAPTGLVYDVPSGDLYVASTGDNEVFMIPNAATVSSSVGLGTLVYEDNVHLHGPLAMVEAPNGHLLVSNNDGINPDPTQPSEIVEFTKQGQFVKELSMDPNPGGAFGMAIYTVGDVATFAAVDDNTNSLVIWTLDLN